MRSLCRHEANNPNQMLMPDAMHEQVDMHARLQQVFIFYARIGWSKYDKPRGYVQDVHGAKNELTCYDPMHAAGMRQCVHVCTELREEESNG